MRSRPLGQSGLLSLHFLCKREQIFRGEATQAASPFQQRRAGGQFATRAVRHFRTKGSGHSGPNSENQEESVLLSICTCVRFLAVFHFVLFSFLLFIQLVFKRKMFVHLNGRIRINLVFYIR